MRATWFAAALSITIALLLRCGGQEATNCTPGETICNGACVTLETDPANCGACGDKCSSGTMCSSGICATSCGGGTSACGESCVDLKTDPNHCGSCDSACPASSACVSGKCEPLCAIGQTRCQGQGGDICADTTSDPLHCGSCDTACPVDAACASSACVCNDSTKTVCKTNCVDLTSDNNNCGQCGNACAGTCTNGRCATLLATGQEPVSILLDSTNVYFADYTAGTVSSVPKNGGAVNVLASSQSHPIRLATDGASLFWNDEAASPLQFGTVPIGGGAVSTIVSQVGPGVVSCLWADATDLYWNGEFAMPKTGGAATYLPGSQSISGAPQDCVMVNDWIYAVTTSDVYKISKFGAYYDLFGGASNVAHVGVDSADIYWTFWDIQNGSGIVKTSLNGGAPAVTIAASPGPTDLYRGLKVDGGYAYTYGQCSPKCSSILRTPVGGGPSTVLVDQLDTVEDLALDATSLYWTDMDGRLMRLTPK